MNSLNKNMYLKIEYSMSLNSWSKKNKKKSNKLK